MCYAVLVLSTKDEINTPMVVDLYGNVDDDLNSVYGASIDDTVVRSLAFLQAIYALTKSRQLFFRISN